MKVKAVTARNDVQVTIRVDKDLKESAEKLFNRLGMNMSTAFNVFLRKAVTEEAIPFAVSAKPSGFGAGYSVDEITKAFREAVEEDIANSHKNGLPVARYDEESKRAYIEYADGRREYTNG